MAVYQSLTLTQISQDLENNTSCVQLLWQSTQTGESYNNTPRTATYWVTVNGGTEMTDTTFATLPWRQTADIFNVLLTVPHNEKGEAVITVRTYMDTRISAGEVRMSRSLTLTQIPQGVTVTAADGTVGGVSKIAVTGKQDGHSYTLSYRFGALTGFVNEKGKLSENPVFLGEDSLQMELPETFYGQMTDKQEELCQLICHTYCDGAMVGNEKTCSFLVGVQEADCLPLVAVELQDINPCTLALTGDERVIVGGESTLLCRMQSEARKGATLTHRFLDGVLLSENTEEVALEKAGGNVVGTVTDSRGFSASFYTQNQVIPYTPPTLKAQVIRTHPTNGTARLTVEGSCFWGSFGAVENEVLVSFRANDGLWETLPAQRTETGYCLTVDLTGLSYDRIYTVQLQVRDGLYTLEKRLTLKKSVPVFDWGETDFCFHVPVTVEGGLAVDGSPIKGVEEILQRVYPVGAVFWGSTGCSPDTWFGGSWQTLSQEGELCRWLRTA